MNRTVLAVKIIKCPMCKVDKWEEAGDTLYKCTKCDYILDIKRTKEQHAV
jgi:rubredoxin